MLAPWEQLQTAYTTSVGVSDKLSFVTSAGQRLVAEMTCAQLQELGGISTIYVMPAVVTPPPEDEEDGEEQGQEEKGLVKGFFDGFEEIVAEEMDDSTDDLVAQAESCRPRTRLATPEVRLSLLSSRKERRSRPCFRGVRTVTRSLSRPIAQSGGETFALYEAVTG